MRPIERGEWPLDKQGVQIAYSDYAKARPELIKRLGEYCSYCEMHLDSSLAVEHVQPKKPPGAAENISERELNWFNFLLSCTNCNSIKGSLDVVLSDYVWPHTDNTFRALVYREGGIIAVNDALPASIQQKAHSTILLTGLDRQPLNNPTAREFNQTP
jgi:uncharacterized protein (TIGR02646 family)